mgnify:FL=1|jgi:hypothetical protein
MKNKLLKEYRTWFDIFKSQLIQNADRQKNATYPKIRQAILAEDAERYEQQLTGMLHLIRGLELLTEQEYEKLSKEVSEEFDTKKLFNFGSYRRTEVYEC